MASNRDSDSLDDLFDFGDDDPPPRAGTAARRPPAPQPATLPPPATDSVDEAWEEEDGDRTTALPPMPQPQYVQTMMELGEMKNPSDGRRSAPREPTPPTRDVFEGGFEGPRVQPRPRAATERKATEAMAEGVAKLGLVMASEAELLLPIDAAGPEHEEQAPRGKTSPIGPAYRNPSVGRATPAVISLRDTDPRPPRPTRPTRPAPHSRPSAPALPTPRAPSIPPGGYDPDDALAELDALAAALQQPEEPAREQPPQPAWRAGAAPRPAMRQSRTPSSGGLRILRPAPQPESEGDRATPVGDADAGPSSVPDHVREMQVRFAAKNFGGALVLAESVLASDPSHAVAQQTAESCREMIGQKYLVSLGGRTGIPRVAMSPDEMRAESLDHRAGFLVSLIDGSMTIEEVIDMSSMAELDALRILFELRQQGVIEIQEPPKRRR